MANPIKPKKKYKISSKNDKKKSINLERREKNMANFLNLV